MTTEERISHERMKTLCPGLTPKTELVLISSPATGDEAMYGREGGEGGWLRLGGGAAPEGPSPGAAPLSGERGSERKGCTERDEGYGVPSEPAASIPEISEANPERRDES